MILAPNTIDLTVDVLLVDDFGYPVTGRVAGTFPAVTVSRGTGADTALSLVDLANLAAAHVDGGIKERGQGRYRLDLPDAPIAAAGVATLRAESSGARLIASPIQIAEFGAGLRVTVPGNFAAGTAGYLIGTNLPSILARLVATARVNSALADNGSLKLIRGDTHENWVNPTVTWDISTASDLSAAVATLTVKIGTQKHPTSGTVANVGANLWRATFAPQIPNTFPIGQGNYDVELKSADATKVATIALGPATIVPDITRPVS